MGISSAKYGSEKKKASERLMICENCHDDLATGANGLCDKCQQAEDDGAIRQAHLLEEQSAWEKLHQGADTTDYVDGEVWRVTYLSPMQKYKTWGYQGRPR